MKTLPIGTAIYYTGDAANIDGFGKIVRAWSEPKFGDFYDIQLEDGRLFRRLFKIAVSDTYNDSGRFRFVTRDAYNAWRDERLQILRETAAKFRSNHA